MDVLVEILVFTRQTKLTVVAVSNMDFFTSNPEGGGQGTVLCDILVRYAGTRSSLPRKVRMVRREQMTMMMMSGMWMTGLLHRGQRTFIFFIFTSNSWHR